jgi:hypothetical protein
MTAPPANPMEPAGATPAAVAAWVVPVVAVRVAVAEPA